MLVSEIFDSGDDKMSTSIWQYPKICI